MSQHVLQLNGSKTEAILVGTPHQIQTSVISSVTFSGQNIPLSTSVTNLGVKMDSHLTFETHVKQLCKTSFFHLRNIARLRPMLTIEDAEKLVHAFVSSRLDYCNALLIRIPGKNLQKLQYIQNSAARILMRVRKYDHITPILKTLHWLPVSFRIVYKVSLLTHQCIHGNAPSYLKELLTPCDEWCRCRSLPITPPASLRSHGSRPRPTRHTPQSTKRTLRSASSYLLKTPRTKLRTMGDRAFCSSAPNLWNALPVHLRTPQPVNAFKRGLKTYLFSKAFE